MGNLFNFAERGQSEELLVGEGVDVVDEPPPGVLSLKELSWNNWASKSNQGLKTIHMARQELSIVVPHYSLPTKN